ncbi:MAG TPA: hypothetical protein VFX97_09995 [Pyrinomonadaceae bacterium]|nr:hypothetical protein [Pyrinomonadaceae bacterium]
MKKCPQCNRVETDGTLKFCRVDGATLVTESSGLAGEAGTAQLGSSADASEVHTSILPHTSTSPEINRPTHWYSITFRAKRQFDGSLREMKRAQELDPLSANIGSNVAMTYLLNNNEEAAVGEFKKAIDWTRTFHRRMRISAMSTSSKSDIKRPWRSSKNRSNYRTGQAYS